MFKKLVLFIVVLIFSNNYLLAQLNPWTQTTVTETEAYANYWNHGNLVVNLPLFVPSSGIPTLFLHSYSEITNSMRYPASIRLQTECNGDTSNLFGNNYIDFWSNNYDSIYSWQTGRISTFTNTEETFDSLPNYYGGLVFSSSGGPTRAEAENGPVDVMYVYDKKVGIWQSAPKEKLHVGGWIRSDSLSGSGIRQVFADYEGKLIVLGDGEPCEKPWCTAGNTIDNDDGSEFLGSLNAMPVIFKTQGQEVLRLNTTQNGLNDNTVFELKMNEWSDYPRVNFGYCDDNPNMRLIRQTGLSENCSGDQVNQWWLENWTGDGEQWHTYGALHFKTDPNAHCLGQESMVTRMALLRNGNVGIGTVNPVDKFDVSLRDDNGGLPKVTIGLSSDNNPVIKLYRATGGGECTAGSGIFPAYNWWIENWYSSTDPASMNGALHFRTSGDGQCVGDEIVSTKLTILKDGNIGVGTVNPVAKLQVIGNVVIGQETIVSGDYTSPELAVSGIIVAKEIVVTDGDEWGDFVFDEDYELLDLDELEQKIKELGHLPGIPSAVEVNQNGVNIRGMQNKMLQKIEEISLYLIELKKENTKLTQKIQELESTIK